MSEPTSTTRIPLGSTVTWGTRGCQGVLIGANDTEGVGVVRVRLTATSEPLERIISLSALTVLASQADRLAQLHRRAAELRTRAAQTHQARLDAGYERTKVVAG